MITDGTFTTAQPTGPIERHYPLKDQSEHYTLTQKMHIIAANYTGPTMDAAHGTYTTAYCVGDSNFNLNGPLLEFERMWSTVPDAKDNVGSQNVTFPAFGSTTSNSDYEIEETSGVAVQRFPGVIPRASSLTLKVPTRIRVEYILPGIAGYGSIHEVPIDLAFRLVDVNGKEVANLEATDATPDETTYANWIKTGTEIVVKSTALSPYLGNIWKAETVYTRAR